MGYAISVSIPLGKLITFVRITGGNMSRESIIIWLGSLAVVFMVPKLLGVVVRKKAYRLLMDGEYQSLRDYLKSNTVRFVLSPYEVEMLVLSSFQAEGNRDEINRQFTLMFQDLKLNEKQLALLVNRAFSWYMESMQFDKVKELIQLGDGKLPESQIVQMRRYFDILACRKSCYIDELEVEVARLKENKLANKLKIGMNQYLLAMQYSYLGDNREANRWMLQAVDNCKNSPFEQYLNSSELRNIEG